MSANSDQAKGRVKEAVGDVTGNEKMKNEGKADRLFKASDATDQDLGEIGLKRGHVMGSYAHIISEVP